MGRHPIFVVLVIWLWSSGMAPSASQVYSKAVKFAKAGQEYFAFMHYSSLLRNFPVSKYREQALFATGEYYYRMSGFDEAAKAFESFLREYPDSEDKLYALAYLLGISERQKINIPVEDIKKQIIKLYQVSFVFRESKELTFKSPLFRNYKTVIQIDRIEFYVEGELIAKVSY